MNGAGYLTTDAAEQIGALTARELVRMIRAGGPAELVAELELELCTRRAGGGARNRERAAWYDRAEYFAWEARRHGLPAGNDPHGGRPWTSPAIARAGRTIGRAMHHAAALECYRIARGYPCPLP